MTPSPQERKAHFENSESSGDRVVISGMSGLYPKAGDVKAFSEILYNQIDPITTQKHRWNFKHPDLVNHIGLVPNLNRFDSQFFKLSHRNGDTMDIMARKLLEQAYQAIYDAGLSPEHLSGRNVGIFVGSCFSETEKACFYHDNKLGSGIIGCSKTMFSNRISYWLDVKGPSYTLDQSCCSSVAVLEAAYHAIERGDCEAAIVGAGSLCLHPQTMINFGRIITLSPDGKTKSFDENADGCVKSEAINVLFLQKAKDALRIYADVVHAKSIFTAVVEGENGPKFGFYRDSGLMAAFLKEFYKEANVTPNSVEYVDAFGAGTYEVDKAELIAFDEVFCNNRNDPLIVGSVMSNIGYTEAASGIASITKVLIGYQKGKIAANLNCKNPHQDIPALKEKRMIIATDHQPIHGSYAAINSLSYNGVNAHVLLHGHSKQRKLDIYKSTLPRLVTISGRHENAVKHIFDDLKSRSIDPEELALLHNIHEKRINGHLARGYAIIDTNPDGKTIGLGEKVEHFDDVKRPLWFVYSGMGSQWIQMGLHLMRVPVFAATIERCHRVLKEKGLDLIHILTADDKTIFDNILHAFVGITAVQIGLTDVIREIGIIANNFIGHSLGEVACAYADGTLTVEQAILTAYARGRVSVDIPVIKGCMAAVGVGYQQIKNMCPEDIFVACHNGPDSSTLSGPNESIKKFVANLTSQGIFAKEVQAGNIAFHSKYIKDMSEPHLKILREIIKNPVTRSERWISTSVPRDRWHEDIAKYSSPDYHNNNMSNPVLFEESLKLVPPNAVLIEIAPHGLLQAILKRSLSSDCRHIPLTRRGHQDNAMHLLNALGSLFLEGYNPQVGKLYPKVEFPVSTETPSLSHLIQWTHDEQWNLPLYMSGEKRMSAATKHFVTIHDEEYKYLRGNVVRGRIVYPFAAALVAAWDTLAMSLGLEKKKLSVQFRDVHLFAQPILQEQRRLKLNVLLHRGTGKFEISDELSKVATGYITGNSTDVMLPKMQFESTEPLDLESKDVYELLQERDYSYRDDFRTIYKANVSLTEAQLLWTNNWVTLIDGILQLNTLQVQSDTVCHPTYIRRICIDVEEQMKETGTSEDKTVVTAFISNIHNLTKCGGIIMDNIKFHKLPPLKPEGVDLKTIGITPHSQSQLTNGVWSEENLMPWEEKSAVGQDVVLKSLQIGEVESLKWVESAELNGPGVIVDVHFAGLNDCDGKRAMGVIPFKEGQDFVYGMDFSGKTKSGTPVMGVVSSGAVRSTVLAHPELLWDVPKQWSLQDAATVPLAYSMAMYCLKMKAEISHGMTVLILGGAGALGQAVISIALAYDCEVFTTVSNHNKKHLLLKLFPELNEKNIGYSRDVLFGDTVLKATKGEGCDIVITCASGELKDVSLNCCAFSGVTIDTVQLQSMEKYAFGLRHLTKQRSYIAVDFSSVFDYVEDMKKIKKLVTEGIEEGYVRPLTYVTYCPKDAVAAFKLLESPCRNGRVLISLRDSIVEAECRFNCSPNDWQIIICDDVVGIHFTEKLILRGARKLLLCSSPSGYLQVKIRSWREQGVEVELLEDDITEPDAVNAIVNKFSRKGRVEGMYIFLTQTENQELETSISKLDVTSRKLSQSLRKFVVASTSRLFGNKIYLSRIQEKLPVIIIHLPSLKEVDMTNISAKISRRAGVDATLKALVTSTANIYAYPQETKRSSLLQELASIADIELPSNILANNKLEDLGIPDNKTQTIKAYLRDSYNIYFEENVIPSLTVQTIHDIEENSIWCGFENLQGLQLFYSHIGSDEVLASTPIVFMNTRAKYSRQNEFDVDRTSLAIIPGMEGHHSRFQRLCERLKLPAFTLQPGYVNPRESIQNMAQRYAQVLTKKMKIKNDFYLLGYESGVLVALETAKILEMDGRKGTVFCVGQTPEELKTTIKDIIVTLNKNGTKLEDAVAKHMVNLTKGDNNAFAKIEAEVYAAHDWNDKLEICVQELVGHNGHSYQYIQSIINAALQRIIQLSSYEINPFKLQSKIVLLHSASTCDPKTLQCFSKEPIAIHNIDSPLGCIVQDLRSASVINRHLSQDVLSLFEQNNLCETYLSNGNTFLFVPCPE